MHLPLVSVALALLAMGADPQEATRPLTIAVVESGTGHPVKQFSYRYSHQTRGKYKGFGDVWTAVDSADGTFRLDVPVSCKLSLEVKGRDHVGGRAMERECIVRSDDAPGRIVLVELTRGATVRGVVRDIETKRPITGATVKATVPGGMLIMQDDDWAVKTDAAGRYEIRGVDPRFSPGVAHPDYSGEELGPDGRELGMGFSAVRDVYLKKRNNPPLQGIVRSVDGTPLEGVRIVNRYESKPKPLATSARDGSFSVRDRGTSSLRFVKEGFAALDLSIIMQVGKAGDRHDVTMEPQTLLEGRVVDRGGAPVAAFTIRAGTGPVLGPDDHVEAAVANPSGDFSLALDHPGKTWVGVRAAGFAVWDGFAEVAKGGKPIEVRLDGGVTLTARVVAPNRGQGEIRAELVPRRDKTERKYGLSGDLSDEEFSTLKADVPADGVLRFPHVRPDRYLLTLQGPTITPRRLAIDVPAIDLDLGEVKLAGRGRIVGRVFRPEDEGGGPWEFVWGGWSTPSLKQGPWAGFSSDEDGRFVIEDVPEGEARLRFLTARGCVITGPSWTARVLARRTTEVHAFEPGKERPLTVTLAVGDGSLAQYASGSGLSIAQLRQVDEPGNPGFSIRLAPMRHDPVAFHDMHAVPPDAERRITLRDAGPSEYRLRVVESSGEDVVRFDRVVTVPPPSRSASPWARARSSADGARTRGSGRGPS